MFAPDLTKKSTAQDKNPGLPDCTVVSSRIREIPAWAAAGAGPGPLLRANELLAINPGEFGLGCADCREQGTPSWTQGHLCFPRVGILTTTG